MTSEEPRLAALRAIEARGRRRTIAMWIAIAACMAILILLLGAGFGDSAWSIAALLLMLSCFGICGWAGYSSQRDIDHLVERAREFARDRDAERQRH